MRLRHSAFDRQPPRVGIDFRNGKMRTDVEVLARRNATLERRKCHFEIGRFLFANDHFVIVRLLIPGCAFILILFVANTSFAGNSVLDNPRDGYWSTSAPEVFQAKFQTNKGEFVIEAHRAWAPRGVD